MSAPEAAVILLNYNGWKDTVECLESLFRINEPTFRVIVCDNASPDGSMEKIRSWADGKLPVRAENPELKEFSEPNCSKPVPYILYDRAEAENGGDPAKEKKTFLPEKTPPLILIQNGKNLGFAGGNNTGVRYALKLPSIRYFWILNNDTVVRNDSLSGLVRTADAHEKDRIGLFGSKLLHYYEPGLLQGVGGLYNPIFATNNKMGYNEKDHGQYDNVESRADYVIGASMFVTRDFLADVGLMSEEYFLYYEELDWQKRAERKGWRSGFAHASVVYHKEGRSIGTSKSGTKRSAISDYYQLKNRLLFTKKYYPFLYWIVALSFLAVIANRVLRGQFDRLPAAWNALLQKKYPER